MTKNDLRYLYPQAPAAGSGKEIFPGIHWLRLPLPFDLDHINLWLLKDGEGYTLVDTGMSVGKTRAAWEGLLKEYLKGKAIHRIIVTHYHPDHVGLAAWLGARFSPEFCLTAPTFERTHYLLHPKSDEDKKNFAGFYARHGVEDIASHVEFCLGAFYKEIVSGLPPATSIITDDQLIEIGEYTWRASVDYGHAEGHLSLYCDELQVLISGDQVLPTISTNISIQANEPEADNLKLYLDSLQGFQTLPAETCVLPSHGGVFQGLHIRLQTMQAHHEKQLARVYALCHEPHTAAEIILPLYGRELHGLHQVLGFGETLAHLVYLENTGRLKKIQDGEQFRYVQK